MIRRGRTLLAAAALATAVGVALLGGTLRGEAAAHDAASLTELGLRYQQLARVTGAPENYGPSERALTRALDLDPQNVDALLGLAALAASRHRFDEALVLGRRVLALRPDSAAAYGIVGDANLELGRYRAAFAAFDRAVALKPNASAYARVSYARELLGRTDAAIDAMKLAVDAAGGAGEPAAWARFQLGNLYLSRGRLSEAELRFREALVFEPRYANAFAGLGAVAETRGRLRAATSLYRRALSIAPVPDVAVSLGDALSRLGRRAAAELAYARAVRLEERFAAAGGRNDLETAMFDLDHDRNVADALRRARAGYAERPSIEGEHVLAWALYKNGRCAEARRHSIRHLRLGTPDLDGLYHRSLIERCLGNPEAAAAFTRRLRSLDPYYLTAPPSPWRLGQQR